MQMYKKELYNIISHTLFFEKFSIFKQTYVDFQLFVFFKTEKSFPKKIFLQPTKPNHNDNLFHPEK